MHKTSSLSNILQQAHESISCLQKFERKRGKCFFLGWCSVGPKIFALFLQSKPELFTKSKNCCNSSLAAKILETEEL